MKITHLLGAAIVAAAVAAPSHAAILTFNDLTAFQNAAGPTTLETFNNAALGVSTNNFSGNFAGFTLTTLANGDYSGIATGTIASLGDNNTIPAPYAGQKFFGWGDASSNGNGGIAPTSTFALSAGATAFGFNWFNTDFSDSYSVFVNNQAVFTLPVESNGFVGFVANAGDTITNVRIQTLNAGGYISTVGIDNVRVSAANAVPEPTGLALLGIGLLGLVSRRRQSRAR